MLLATRAGQSLDVLEPLAPHDYSRCGRTRVTAHILVCVL